MIVGIGGAVHVVSGPLLELLCVDGVGASVVDSLAMKVVAGGQLQVSVYLFAH